MQNQCSKCIEFCKGVTDGMHPKDAHLAGGTVSSSIDKWSVQT